MKSLNKYICEQLKISSDIKLEKNIILDKYSKIKSVEVAMQYSHLQSIIDHKMIADKIKEYSKEIPVYTDKDTKCIDLRYDTYDSDRYKTYNDKEITQLKNIGIILLLGDEKNIKNNKLTRDYLQPYFKNQIKKVEWFVNMHSISLCIYLKEDNDQFLRSRYAVKFALKIKIDKH